MFIVEASRKLFLARTKTEGLFKEAKNSLPEPEFDSKKACKEIKKHHTIYLSSIDGFKLYLSNKLGKFFPFKNWSKRQKLTKLY